MAVDAVLFDLDDTLLEYERHGSELLALAFEAVGVEPFFGVEAYYGRYEEFLDDSEDVVDLRERCFAALAADCGRDPGVGRAVARAYSAERDHSRVRLRPGAAAALDALAGDHRLGLVTNGAPEMQRQKLRGVGIADRFGTVVFAGHDAPPKPDPGPFQLALEDLGATPDRAVHVGNSLRSDVAGARAAGLASVWVPAEEGATPDPEPDYALPELTAFLPPPWEASGRG